MKELTIEQKAKAYDKAIERAKVYYSTTNSVADAELIELIFPELKENEDEDIKQFLIDFIKVCGWTEKKDQGWPSKEKCIAWLEKQKPVELQWRPTEGQMDSIKQAVANMKNSGSYDSELVSLYNELKAL